MTLMRRSLFAALLLAAGAGPAAAGSGASSDTLRVGYFLGGRTSLLMRMTESGAFAPYGLDVVLLTKKLREKDYAPIDAKAVDADKHDVESKATGLELTEGLMSGRWELATPGESSFVDSVAHQVPVVAVATLGHDVRGESGHLFAVRKEINVEKPDDYKGLLLLSRRAGPGYMALLREYLTREGVDLDKDAITLPALPKTLEERRKLPKDKVILVHKVDDDVLRDAIVAGIADGGFMHLKPFESLHKYLKPIKPLEAWVNPDISQAFLICRRDYLKDPKNRDAVKRFIKAFIVATRQERALKPWQRETRGRWQSLQSRSKGLNYPQYDDVPIVKTYLLEEVTDLLHRQAGVVYQDRLDFTDYIDNSLVLEAASELEAKPSWK